MSSEDVLLVISASAFGLALMALFWASRVENGAGPRVDCGDCCNSITRTLIVRGSRVEGTWCGLEAKSPRRNFFQAGYVPRRNARGDCPMYRQINYVLALDEEITEEINDADL